MANGEVKDERERKGRGYLVKEGQGRAGQSRTKNERSVCQGACVYVMKSFSNGSQMTREGKR